MKNRTPVSFVLMCIVFGLILIGIVPGFFIRASESPKWYGALMLTSILSTVLLAPVSAIFGMMYRTEDARNKKRNRFGLWSSLVIVAGILGLIVYALYFDDHSGYGMPG